MSVGSSSPIQSYCIHVSYGLETETMSQEILINVAGTATFIVDADDDDAAAAAQNHLHNKHMILHRCC